MRQRYTQKNLSHVAGAHERIPLGFAALLATLVYKRPEPDIPSGLTLKVQYAFSILLIRGILPNTALIAFCGVLHRYSSRDIHC